MHIHIYVLLFFVVFVFCCCVVFLLFFLGHQHITLDCIEDLELYWNLIGIERLESRLKLWYAAYIPYESWHGCRARRGLQGHRSIPMEAMYHSGVHRHWVYKKDRMPRGHSCGYSRIWVGIAILWMQSGILGKSGVCVAFQHIVKVENVCLSSMFNVPSGPYGEG